jgi:hypothetical protein
VEIFKKIRKGSMPEQTPRQQVEAHLNSPKTTTLFIQKYLELIDFAKGNPQVLWPFSYELITAFLNSNSLELNSDEITAIISKFITTIPDQAGLPYQSAL